MSDTALALKGALSLELGKQGHTLADLETALSEKDQTKTASLLKNAEGLLNQLKSLLGLGASGAGILGGTALGAGAIGGAGLFGAYKGLEDTKHQREEAEAIRQRIDVARKELESAQLLRSYP